ncbi:MAG: tail protein X [Rhodospirillaceae bacterium]|nr:tail protein X [Rhodospirillales bacterium]
MAALRSVIAKQGETVDQIAARCYDGDTAMVPAILAANPGLADLGTALPHGTTVMLPEKITIPKTLTSLWD